MTEGPLRLAFADISDEAWPAGAYYYQNLFFALSKLPPTAKPHIALLRWPDARDGHFEGYGQLVDELLWAPSDPPPPSITFWQRQSVRVARTLGTYREPAPREPALSQYLRQNGIDALFTCWREFGPHFNVPIMAWIPDFQHLRLAEFFEPEEIARRVFLSEQVVMNASRVVVSSKDAQSDFGNFAPEYAGKARLLPFVSQVPPGTYDTDPGPLCEYYNLPKRYLFLPNQFWRHKNHQVVLQALSLVKAGHPEITVVCTGNTHDSRSSLFFGQFLAKISMLGLRENLIVLGWVPHEHVFRLMRQSLAVLQPSLFEGWSTSVEETKSLGKHILLSDIPVHHEQNPPSATFFDPRDPESLARICVQVYEQEKPGPNGELEALARSSLPKRQEQFALDFLGIAQETALSPSLA